MSQQAKTDKTDRASDHTNRSPYRRSSARELALGRYMIDTAFGFLVTLG